ncbi:MAG: hypothetical protein MJ192_08730 [Clostridia bacterium]|nr:hypothetical protein [Clostridia bacterium]
MGFGLLLCGYFILTFMSFAAGEYAFAAYIIGGTVCFFAASKLYEYKHRFAITVGTSLAYILIGVYYGVVCMDHLLLWELPVTSAAVIRVMDEILFAVELVHILGALWAVYELASQVGVERVRSGVERNFAFVAVSAVGELAMHIFLPGASVDDPGTDQNLRALIGILILIRLVTYLLNVWLFYRCYQLICPAGEENGRPDKKSRFKFINDINEKLDEKAQRAMNENIEYQKQKAKERESRRGTHKKRR